MPYSSKDLFNCWMQQSRWAREYKAEKQQLFVAFCLFFMRQLPEVCLPDCTLLPWILCQLWHLSRARSRNNQGSPKLSHLCVESKHRRTKKVPKLPSARWLDWTAEGWGGKVRWEREWGSCWAELREVWWPWCSQYPDGTWWYWLQCLLLFFSSVLGSVLAHGHYPAVFSK